jgi:phosphoribosylformimino-5-aminoimidazole carboxamide ribotide isomerase
MELIPAIDIRGGRCVRLVQGDYARETVFSDDPVAMAQRWVDEGATRIHVVDLDGAKERRPVNDAIVRRIIDETGARVQVAGGMRDAAAIDGWADAGAERIVVGTLAVEVPDVVEDAVRRHGERIVVAIDARDGKMALKGWLETSAMAVEELMREMMRRGVRHFVYTDIARDGRMEHPDFASFRRVLEGSGVADDGEAPVIYSGGVTSIDDVIELAECGIEGVIIGRALYDGSIDLRAARRALVVGDDW